VDRTSDSLLLPLNHKKSKRNSLAIKSKGGFCRGRIYPTRGFDESNPYNTIAELLRLNFIPDEYPEINSTSFSKLSKHIEVGPMKL